MEMEGAGDSGVCESITAGGSASQVALTAAVANAMGGRRSVEAEYGALVAAAGSHVHSASSHTRDPSGRDAGDSWRNATVAEYVKRLPRAIGNHDSFRSVPELMVAAIGSGIPAEAGDAAACTIAVQAM